MQFEQGTDLFLDYIGKCMHDFALQALLLPESGDSAGVTSTVLTSVSNLDSQSDLSGSLTISISERPKTPPNPTSTVLFHCDPDFIDHEEILDCIHQRYASLGSWTTLVGLGGVGNAAWFEQSYQDIINVMRIPGRQDLKANIFQLVYDWLYDNKKGKWVLILDNVDNADFLVKNRSTIQQEYTNSANGPDSKNLQLLLSYFPQYSNGLILITTQSKDITLKLVELHNIIILKPISKGDALTLFKNKLRKHDNDNHNDGNGDDNDNVAKLATALEFMPLAIV
ncbi:hypothetical protein B7463_g3819, partial [Scytalidium lignicola]